MGKITVSGEIVLDYLSKYPEWMPSAALARLIFKENKNHFENSEQIRSLVRMYRGKQGKIHRETATVKTFYDKEVRSSLPYVEMPETWVKDKMVYVLPISIKRMGFISDLQVPFHDPKAIDVCFKYLQQQNINALYINGDLVDFYQLSEYEKDPRERKFEEEYEAIIEMLAYIRKSFPKIPIYYNMDANHEFRYARYMRKKAPELLGLKIFELDELLRLNEFKITPILGYDHTKFGKLPIIHGDTTFKRGSGVTPAKYLYDKVKQSCIASHVHRTSEFTTKNQFDEDIYTTYTVGHLMHPNVEYCKHIDSYNQGFAVLEKDKNGYYTVYNKRIIKYKVY